MRIAGEGVDKAHGSVTLMPARLAAVLRLADRLHVLQAETVATVDPDVESGLDAHNRLRSPGVIQGIAGADELACAGDIVAARVQFEYGPFAKEQTQCEERLRGDAVVVVPVSRGNRGRSGGTEAYSSQ